MKTRKAVRYSLFALMYFIQGGIMGYFTSLNAIYLQTFGLTLSQIGLISSIIMIPFVLKIFVGMLSDRVSMLGWGYRKPYILLGLIVQYGCLLVVPLINPKESYGLYTLTAFLMVTGMAFYDTCTDGLALDTTTEADQGTVQGLMVGGRAFGVVIVSALLGVIADALSWKTAFWTLAAVTLVPFPLAWMIKEGFRPTERRFEWKAFGAFTKPNVIALALYGALYSLVIYGVNEVLNPFLQYEYGISTTTVGFITTAWGIGVVIGGILGGRVIDRIGQRKAVVTGMIMASAAILILCLITNLSIAWPAVVIFGLAFGFYETVYFALSMRRSDPRIAASMYAILMAVANIGTSLGFSVAANLVDLTDYRIAFAVMAGINVLVLPLLGPIFREKKAMEVAVN